MNSLLKSTTLIGALLAAGSAHAQDDSVTLNWALWDLDAAPFFRALAEEYHAKNPDVTIEYTDLGSADYPQMLMTQLTGGAENLDIVTIKDIPSYSQLVRTNSLVNLSEALDPPVDPAPYGGLIDELSVNDALYGLPFRADIWVVYYNKDLFDAAGVDYPTNDMTWAQYDDVAREMTTGFGPNKVYGTHNHIWRSTVQLPGIQDGQHTLIAQDYSFLAPWYERALALQQDGIVQTYASLKTSAMHYSGPFYNEQVAMLPMGSWFIGTQIDKVNSGESLADNWGIVSLPHPEGVAAGTTAATVTSLGVNSNSPHREAALEFVRWAAGPEGAAVVAKAGVLPALVDDTVLEMIASSDGFPQDDNSRAALRASQTYLELPVNAKAAEIELILNRAHDLIMTENVSIEDGIAQMNEGVAPLLGD